MDPQNLEKVVGPKALVTDPAELDRYAMDGHTPLAAALPGTLGQAAELIRLANQEGFSVAIRGRGARASIGGLLKTADVVLSTSRLDKIIDMDTDNLTVTTQAGVAFGDLQDLLTGLENGCFFPLDGNLKETADYMCSNREYKGAFVPLDPPLAYQSTLGGIVAANVTGPMRMRYRPLRDLLLGVRFVTPTGDLIGMGGKTVKNVSGYDVSKLMIGTQGCLGLVGEMTIRLLPLPERTGAMLVFFTQASQARAFVQSILGSKLLPTAVEVLNQSAYDLADQTGDDLSSGGLAVAVGQAGFDEEVAREIEDLKDMARKEQARGLIELDADNAASFWRKLGDNTLSRALIKFKANYVFSGFSDFIDEAALADEGCAVCVSAGSSVSHIYFTDDALDQAARMGRKLRAKAANLKGALVLEAAPPGVKEKFDPWGPPRSDFALMAKIKTELDPNGLLNPGRFVGGV